MDPTLKDALRNTLDNLSGNDFKRFKHKLKDQSTITWRVLERADTDETVNEMVRVYSMDAGSKMVAILREMNHNQLVMDLKRQLGTSTAQQQQTGATSSGGQSAPQQKRGKAFFDKHKYALETRLGLLQPILGYLEQHGAISRGEREQVQSKATNSEKNKALIDCLEEKGARAQEKFYEALQIHNKYLVDDLEYQE